MLFTPITLLMGGTLAVLIRHVVGGDPLITNGKIALLSLLAMNEPIPLSIIDMDRVTAWCPWCFAGGRPVPAVEGLDTYLSLLKLAFKQAIAIDPGFDDARRNLAMATRTR